MPGIANVSLTDTFDTWRIRTNQLIISYDQSYGFMTNTANDLANSVNVSIASVINSGNNANVFAMKYANTIGNTSNLFAIAYTNSYANTAANNANSYSMSYANASFYTIANGTAAFAQANAANVLAFNTGIGANAYAVSIGASSNAWSNTKVATVSGTSGRITSSGTTGITLDLATAGAGACNYTTGISAISVDAYGRVTSVTDNANYEPALGFTPVRQGGGTGQGTNTLRIGWGGSQLFLQVDSTNYSGTWPINITGSAGSATSATFATTATSATNATNASNADNLGGVAALSYARLNGATFTGAISAPSVTTSGAMSAGSLAGAAATGTGASGTWPINISGNAGNGRTLLNTINLNNSATAADITSFSSSYTYFDVELVNLVPVTDAVLLYMRVYSGAAYQSSNYATSGVIPSSYFAYGPSGFGAPSGAYQNQALLSWISSAVENTAAMGGVCGRIRVNNPVSDTSRYKQFYGLLNYPYAGWSGAHMPTTVGFSWNGGTAAVTGFQIYFSSGNISSGQVRIYGYN